MKYDMKLISAVAIDGKIQKAGATITVGEAVAKDLLRRGKATLMQAPAAPVEDEAAAAGAEVEDKAAAAGKKK